MSDPAPFDRMALRQHRTRAAANFGSHNFLVSEAAKRLTERLGEVDGPFPVALDLGCHTGELPALIPKAAGIKIMVLTDATPAMAKIAAQSGHHAVVAEEELLPFSPASFDAVLSCLSLHWVNDLPGTLTQVRHSLKPGGLLLASLLGGETLKELRVALKDGAALLGRKPRPHVSPFIDVRDGGDLLSRAGFARPVADVDTVTTTYGDAFALMSDLRGMGEANARRDRARNFTPRTLMLGAAESYAAKFGETSSRIPATFQIVTLAAWAPGVRS